MDKCVTTIKDFLLPPVACTSIIVEDYFHGVHNGSFPPSSTLNEHDTWMINAYGYGLDGYLDGGLCLDPQCDENVEGNVSLEPRTQTLD